MMLNPHSIMVELLLLRYVTESSVRLPELTTFDLRCSVQTFRCPVGRPGHTRYAGAHFTLAVLC